MNKDEWLKQIFNGAPPGSVGASGSSSPCGRTNAPPAPKLDTSGARSDSLVLSWQWPAAPTGVTFELCWRESNSNGAWQRERLNIRSPAFTSHVLRPLAPNTSYAVAVQVSGGGAGVTRGGEIIATTAPAGA